MRDELKAKLKLPIKVMKIFVTCNTREIPWKVWAAEDSKDVAMQFLAKCCLWSESFGYLYEQIGYNWQWVGRLSERPVLKHGPRSPVRHRVDRSCSCQNDVLFPSLGYMHLNEGEERSNHVIMVGNISLHVQHVPVRVVMLQNLLSRV